MDSALDYPPFFAYFSYTLTLPARLLPTHVADYLLQLSEQSVEGWTVTGYMRLSVLVSEFVLVSGLLRSVHRSSSLQGIEQGSRTETRRRLSRSSSDATLRIIALAIMLHPGFIILDSIHFQYNGFLFGIMIWSLVGAKEVGLVFSEGRR